MSQKLTYCIDVCLKIEHHYCKAMAGTMKRDVLADASVAYPTLDNLVGVAGCVYILEYRFVGFATWSHKLGSLRGDVEVFLSACFLLLKDDAGKVSLLLYVLPSKAYNVRPSQAGKAREEEHLLGCSVMAWGFDKVRISFMVRYIRFTSTVLGLSIRSMGLLGK